MDSKKVTLKPSKFVANKLIIGITTLLYLAIFVLFIVCVVGFFTGMDRTTLAVVHIPLVGIALLLLLLNNALSWYSLATLELKDKVLEYTTINLVSGVGSGCDKWIIRSASGVRWSGSTAVITGEIRYKESGFKEKTKKRVAIVDCTDEAKALINEFLGEEKK